MNALKQILTGKDNATHDVMRWMAVIAFLVGMGLTIYTVVWKSQPFDLLLFGTGVGALFVSLGAALKIKESTEPKPQEGESQ